jgi:hypothetical protein
MIKSLRSREILARDAGEREKHGYIPTAEQFGSLGGAAEELFRAYILNRGFYQA